MTVLTTALNSAIGTLRPFDGEIERCYDCTDQFLISWYSYQFRYCSMNNSGLIFVGCNNLKSISLPKGLPLSLDEEEFEGMSPFIGCTSLETIKAPEELKDADWLKEISDRVEVAFY